MTPKEKAEELVDKFNLEVRWNNAKQCALIAVEEIINTGALCEELDYGCDERNLHYWQEVKNEIDKL